MARGFNNVCDLTVIVYIHKLYFFHISYIYYRRLFLSYNYIKY